jgi:hypothetical protein
MRESFERSMTRLSRSFLAQMDQLKKYRAKAQQIVRVERVEVNEGGQAGAVEKTRTSTGVTPQRPQRCASTNSATTARDQVVARSLAEATAL